ncbi:MAG: hypothetical protein ACRDX8_14435 [Acidimicrobiales bacterium]
MYDTVGGSVDAIAPDAPAVAGYVDGAYAWTSSEWARFTTHRRLHISVLANADSDTFDSETGNASPTQVAQAARVRELKGLRSVIYCNMSAYANQLQECQGAGVARSAWDWWAARWGQGDAIPPDAVGVQFASSSSPNVDTSNMDDTWANAWWKGTWNAIALLGGGGTMIGKSDADVARALVIEWWVKVVGRVPSEPETLAWAGVITDRGIEGAMRALFAEPEFSTALEVRSSYVHGQR